MNEFTYEKIEQYCKYLRLDLTATEMAFLASERSMSSEQLEALEYVLNHLREKKEIATIQMIMKTSRLPAKNPKTFDNFDFSAVKGTSYEVERLKSLKTLSAIHAHKNLAFIGPPGTGKTHLAQAFGYECCQHGLKTYFIKMSELRDRFISARRNDKISSTINGLVRPSCLIIDEIGHCVFDRENTRLFFDLMDRRYNKEGSFNVIFTSNKVPALWKDNFEENDALLCALDRVFDDATVFKFKGKSYRGSKLETISLETDRVKDPSISK
jgi:DNA replication protein DnaC